MRCLARCVPGRILVALSLLGAAGNLRGQEKAPVPDADAQAAAKKTAAEIYGSRFAAAKKSDEKTALATEIIEAALKVQDGLPGQFVLLTIARDVAAGAGDAVTALKAVDELAKRFEVPAAMQGETLLTAAREAAAGGQRKAVAETAIGVVAKLTQAAEYELALKVCDEAHNAATRNREYALARELAAKETETKRAEKESRGYRDALAVLDKNPVDPEANLAAGRFLCFVQSDWQWGVPMLALGNDADLKAVAANDLRSSDSAEGQLALADAWWELAENREGAEREAMRLRAGSWYRQAAPQLAGDLVGLRIQRRLEEIANLGREIPATSPASRLATEPSDAHVPGAAAVRPIEIVVGPGANVIFGKVSGNKSRAASARIRIPDKMVITRARISGQGHNQDRDGFPRTMEVKINGRVLKVIPAIAQGQTRPFDMLIPPGTLVNGWNDIQAYIEWSNDEYDRGHWVSLALTLE